LVVGSAGERLRRLSFRRLTFRRLSEHRSEAGAKTPKLLREGASWGGGVIVRRSKLIIAGERKASVLGLVVYNGGD
jgi:hypothetical protein